MGMFPKDLDHYIASHKTIQEFNTIEIKREHCHSYPVWLQESDLKVFEINVGYNSKNRCNVFDRNRYRYFLSAITRFLSSTVT